MATKIGKPKKRPNNKSSQVIAVEQRRSKVMALRIRGFRPFEIAEKLGVTREQVDADVRRVRQEWAQARQDDLNGMIAEQLAKIDALEREAWDAWERSKLPAVMHKTGKSIKRGEWEEETTKEQVGDPRYLDTLAKLWDQRAKILGLNAAEKVDHAMQIDVNMAVVSEVRKQVLENVTYCENSRASAIDSDSRYVRSARLGRPPKSPGKVEDGEPSGGD